MRRIYAGALLVGAVAVGLTYFLWRDGSDPKFITAAVERGTISTSVKATGSVDAVITVDVSSQLSGRISEVFVNFNDEVKAGQPIARIDPEIFAARVNEASAGLKVAQATALVQEAAVERARGTTANAELAHKMAEAQTAAAQARLDQAEKELQRKLQLVRSGTVTDRDLLQVQTQRDLPRASSTGAGRTWPSSRSLASTALGRRA